MWVYRYPSTTKPTIAISGEHIRKALKQCGVKNIRPHDLRRTIRTWAAERGVSHDVGERLLGHSKGGVAGIYNRATHNVAAGEVATVGRRSRHADQRQQRRRDQTRLNATVG